MCSYKKRTMQNLLLIRIFCTVYLLIYSLLCKLLPLRMNTITSWQRKSTKSKRNWRRRGAQGYKSRSSTSPLYLPRRLNNLVSLSQMLWAKGRKVSITLYNRTKTEFLVKSVVFALWGFCKCSRTPSGHISGTSVDWF